MNNNLREIKLGAPPSIVLSKGCPNVELSAQVMQNCEELVLKDDGGKCTTQGALKTASALLGQRVNEDVTEQAWYTPIGEVKPIHVDIQGSGTVNMASQEINALYDAMDQYTDGSDIQGEVETAVINDNVFESLSSRFPRLIINSKKIIPHDAVDLGLPSGLLWCTHNVGTEQIEQPGLYFSWGNTDGHSSSEKYNFSGDNYNTTTGSTLTSSIDIAHDAARANMGGKWRMPTTVETRELANNCTVEWITINGVGGAKIISKLNGNWIFIPAAGMGNNTNIINTSLAYYWTATLANSSSAYSLYMNSNAAFNTALGFSRSAGFPIRAVYDA